MSRKHFIAIARALRESDAPRNVVQAVADELACFNGNFDRKKFLTAAGLEG